MSNLNSQFNSLKRRVVVTGLGAVTPLGLDVPNTWQSLIAGRSGIGYLTRIDTSLHPVKIGGEIKGFNVNQWVPLKEQKKMGLFIHYAFAAAQEALRDAGLPLRFSLESGHSPEKIGVCVSSGMGGLPEIEYWDRELSKKEKKSVTPFFVPMIIPNLAAGQLSMLVNAQGPNTCIVTACASSAHTLGESARYIADGYADIMIAGGTEAVISELGMVGFASMRALSTRNQEPERASRPYDKDRDGFVLSEGSAILILEELEHAQKRGSKIYAELVGYGLNADAYHMTTPAPNGEGARRCMQMSIERAGLTPNDIDYVNSHGTSTPAGDSEEAKAIAQVFGNREESAPPLNVSSTKSMTGHLLGAAGALEALICVLSIKDGAIPPTINLDNIDDASASTGLNFTAHKSVHRPVRAALSNSFGFGGTNASLVFRSFS